MTDIIQQACLESNIVEFALFTIVNNNETIYTNNGIKVNFSEELIADIAVNDDLCTISFEQKNDIFCNLLQKLFNFFIKKCLTIIKQSIKLHNVKSKGALIERSKRLFLYS